DNCIYQYHTARQLSSLLLTTGDKELHYPNICNNSLLFISEGYMHEFHPDSRKITASFKIPGELVSNGILPTPYTKLKGGKIIANVPGNGFIITDSINGNSTHYTNIENDPFSLSSNLVYTAVTDHSNNLWLGTEGGDISILNLSPALFETFPSQTVTRRESALLMVK